MLRSSQTDNNLTHDEIEAQIAAGALDSFEWEPPTEQEQAYSEAVEQETTTLVPASQFRAVLAMYEESRRREQDALDRLQRREDELQARMADREQDLQGEINNLQRELGKVEGELSALKAQKRRPPAWWVKLFGGPQSE